MRAKSTIALVVALWCASVVPDGATVWGQVPAAGPQALVAALRQGGYVLVMRHANAPAALPDATTARSGNTARERQLSEAGLRGATEMGRAMRALGIPVGRVFSSPTFRARETATRLGLGAADVVEWLGEGTASMADPAAELVRGLRARASEAPSRGTNVLFITHSPNIGGAFPAEKPAVAEGEVFVVRPAGRDSTVVGRITIDQWPQLVTR